jgi:hypothetical protein
VDQPLALQVLHSFADLEQHPRTIKWRFY